MKIKKSLSTCGDSLNTRVVRSGFWVMSLRVCSQIISFARIVILARILSPSDFGLAEVGILVVSTIAIFTHTGLSHALIQRKDINREYIDTVFTVMALRGIVIFLLLLFSAPYIAAFFNMKSSQAIIQAMGIIAVFEGLNNIGIIYFQRDMEFNKECIFQLTGIAVDLAVAVSLAVVFRNAWAIVLGFIAGSLARFAASYVMHPYRPRIRVNYSSLRELFGFGKWILGSGILVFFITKINNMFIARMLGPAALGLYTMAWRLSNMIFAEISGVVSQITFPLYSKVQDTLYEIREAYLKIIRFISFVSFPLAGMIFIMAGELTKVFLGEKWMAIVPVIRIFAVFGILGSITSSTGALFQGMGRPKVATVLQAIRFLIILLFIYPLTKRWGIQGAAFSFVLSGLFIDPAALWIAVAIIGCRRQVFFRILSLPLTSTAFMLAGIIFVKQYLVFQSRILYISFYSVCGIVSYLFTAYVLDRVFNQRFFYLFKKSARLLFCGT